MINFRFDLDFKEMMKDQNQNLTHQLVKIIKTASEATEEQRRKTKACESVANKIAACHTTVSSLEAEEIRLVEEKKKIQQKTTESNNQLRSELKKADELQSLLNDERTSKIFIIVLALIAILLIVFISQKLLNMRS